MKMKDIFENNASVVQSKAAKILENVQEKNQIDEGRKQVKASNRESIGIDNPHVPGQQVHAHLENGRAVNQDGSLSHGGEPFYLTKAQADALKRANFKIPKSRLIESEDRDKIAVELEPALIKFLLDLKNKLG